MSRTQKILAGVFLVQALLILLTRGPLAEPMGALESRPLLPTLESFTPSKLEIQGPEEKHVTLVRRGDTWGLEQAAGYPADKKKIDDLLSTLKGLQVRRAVVTSSRYHTALKVTEKAHERRVRLWDDPEGDPRVGLYLGSSPNYRITHVRAEGDDRVYEVAGLGVYDVRQDVNAWIQTHFVDVNSDSVWGFRVENSYGWFEVEKNEDGTWQVSGPRRLRGRKLEASKVDSFVRSAASVWVTGPGGALDKNAQGFDRPAATVVLRLSGPQSATSEKEQGVAGTAERQEITFWVGKPVEEDEGRRYIARAGFSFAAIISNSTVEKFLDQKLVDLQ